jgi:hypothetical protein
MERKGKNKVWTTSPGPRTCASRCSSCTAVMGSGSVMAVSMLARRRARISLNCPVRSSRSLAAVCMGRRDRKHGTGPKAKQTPNQPLRCCCYCCWASYCRQ